MIASLLVCLFILLGEASATPALRAPRERAGDRARGSRCGEPTGNWRDECINGVIDAAAGTISANCLIGKGNLRRSVTFDYCVCKGQEVKNRGGRQPGSPSCAKGQKPVPTCGPPRGSFKETCQKPDRVEMYVNNGFLNVDCKASVFLHTTYSFYYCDCKELDVYNDDGRPKCAKGRVPLSYDSDGNMQYIQQP